jgi:hypothetical protein
MVIPFARSTNDHPGPGIFDLMINDATDANDPLTEQHVDCLHRYAFVAREHQRCRLSLDTLARAGADSTNVSFLPPETLSLYQARLASTDAAAQASAAAVRAQCLLAQQTAAEASLAFIGPIYEACFAALRHVERRGRTLIG